MQLKVVFWWNKFNRHVENNMYAEQFLTSPENKWQASSILTENVLHCALSYRSCQWVCDCVCNGRAGGVRTLLQPARAQCLRLSDCFFHVINVEILSF